MLKLADHQRLLPMVVQQRAVSQSFDGFASFLAVDIPVLEIGNDLSGLKVELAREALAVVREDHADVVVLSCTGFLGCAYPALRRKVVKGYRFPEFAEG